jgi:hypothetical protein
MTHYHSLVPLQSYDSSMSHSYCCRGTKAAVCLVSSYGQERRGTKRCDWLKVALPID